MSAYAKAIVPLVVGVLMLVLNQFGITETTTVVEAITMLVTALGVWAVPNKQTVIE